jgi:TonB family protein
MTWRVIPRIMISLASVALLICATGLKAEERSRWLSAAVNAQGIRYRGSEYAGVGPWMDDAIKTVAPNYPYEARSRHIYGSGLFRITLDLNTGSVTKVTVITSTRFPILDNSATDALRQWRWKPGRWKEIDVPITFTMTGSYRQQ